MMGTFLRKLFQAGDQLQLLGHYQTCIENIILGLDKLKKVKHWVHGRKTASGCYTVKRESDTRFSTLGFFTNQVPPGPWVSYWDHFGFTRNRGDTHNFVLNGVLVTGNKLARCRWHRWLGLFPCFQGFHDTGDETLATKLVCLHHKMKNKSNITTKYQKIPIKVFNYRWCYFRISPRIFTQVHSGVQGKLIHEQKP